MDYFCRTSLITRNYKKTKKLVLLTCKTILKRKQRFEDLKILPGIHESVVTVMLR